MSRPVVIPLLNRVELNGSYLGATTARTITLPTIDVTPFFYATLILRVHEATWSGGTPAKFKIEGFASYPSKEDAREFVEATNALSAELTSSDSLPAPKSATTSNLAMAYKFVATLTQGSTAQAALFVVASAELLLRPA
jgi:hypothetical protein